MNSEANMMTSQCPISHFDAGNHIFNSYASSLCNKNWGYPCMLRSYNRLKIGFIFAYFDCKWP